VIEVRNIEALKKIIRTVSITASQIGSQSSTVGDKDKQTQVVEAITQEVENTQGAASQAAPKPEDDLADDWD